MPQATKKRTRAVKPRKIKTTPEEEAFFRGLCRLFEVEGQGIDAIRLLALTCKFVGALAARQDARMWTPMQVMEVITLNIEDGNKMAVGLQKMAKPEGNA